MLVPAPSYIDYARVSTLAGLEVEHLPLRPEEEFRLDLERLERRLHGGELVFLGQPNNPTGQLCNREALCRLAMARPDVSFVVDEAFADFVDGYCSLAGETLANLVVLPVMVKPRA
ncbi:MAG: aminotransferase class I/II-fold pyridoxal phosphate-dependent enzyme [Candidatus Latescibacteria bacterium]|nr:aminotransferase class I/II-fold pyridoxal phosphate-dependent enzyme [Candidatus Latescibacterota bacterium]